MRRLSATQLGKSLSDVLNRVYYRHETVLVERGGKAVCQISPVAESGSLTLAGLIDLLREVPEAGPEYAEAVRAGLAEQEDFEGPEWPHSSTRAS